MTFLDRLNSPKFDFTLKWSVGEMIKFQQSQALTSHVESFWSILKGYFQFSIQWYKSNHFFQKISAANDEVQEWEVKLEESRLNFNKISDVIKAEIDFFERYRVKDFKSSILRYMEDLMECQIQLAQTWETFLPEVKNTLYWKKRKKRNDFLQCCKAK